MKRSGYRTIFHIYLIFFLALLGTVLLTGYFFFQTVSVRTSDGANIRSDWPKVFTADFQEQIIFISDMPQVKQAGMALLQEHKIGIQILDGSGGEVFSYQKPEQASTAYSSTELLQLVQNGKSADGETTICAGAAADAGTQVAYLLYFPVNVSKVTMYVNGERFAGGKTMIVPVLCALFLLVLVSGVLYGSLTTKAIKRLMTAIREISVREYLPVQKQGVFHDLYDSLNTLDAEIRASDHLRAQTEKTREEWIQNITHDLKTPLCPIKGYAEILQETDGGDRKRRRHYAEVMLKNVSYMEKLIEDLKLTYQLENWMLPIRREDKNIVRFVKELVIDILNTPEYENRIIRFESEDETVIFSFDQMLFTRAFRNLIINAFVHGEEHTEVTVSISASQAALKIKVADNGKGMEPEAAKRLFDRYYRGTNTEQKPEGTGLGLAITKGIIDLHGGMISVSSIPGIGTTFEIGFFPVKVN